MVRTITNSIIVLIPVVVEEYEGFKGREGYAEEEGGGYYEARLAVAEALHKMKRQGGVIVFREIHPLYTLPLGVWVVRETVRAAFRNRGKKFETKKEALKYINSRLQTNTGQRLEIRDFEVKSMILGQKRLTDFSWICSGSGSSRFGKMNWTS